MRFTGTYLLRAASELSRRAAVYQEALRNLVFRACP